MRRLERSLDIRSRRYLAGGISGIAARFVSVAASAIVVPRMLDSLGTERYGIYAVLVSLASVAAFADLGLGNGMISDLAQSAESGNVREASQTISSGLALLAAMALTTGILGFVAAAIIPWADLMNVTDTSVRTEVSSAVFALVTVVTLTIPLASIEKIQLSLQESHINSFWRAIGSAIALVAVIVGVELGAGLAVLVTLWLAGPLVALTMQGVRLFGGTSARVGFSRHDVSTTTARRLLRVGAAFFVLQSAVVIAFASDNLVLASVSGPDAVANFAIQALPFTWISSLSGLFLIPMWPAYAAALAAKEYEWLRTTLKRSIVAVGLTSSIGGLTLLVLAEPLLSAWVGSTIRPSVALLAALATLTTLTTLGTAMSVFLNAIGHLRFQVVTASAMSAVALGLKIAGAAKYGAEGLVGGTIIAYVGLSFIPTALYLRRMQRALD